MDQKMVERVADAIAAVQGRCSLAAAEAAIRAVEDYGACYKWQPIETVPKDRTILVYGQPCNMSDGSLTFTRPAVYTARWDEIDEALILSGGTWEGPFIYPSHWMDRPESPAAL